jgi:CubicO group peptidase (beta-lactamase class C family)
MRVKKWRLFLLLITATATASPVNPDALRAAAAYSNSQRGSSFLALENGRVLLEQSAGEAHKIYSGTKAFWGLAALAAAEDGLLSLDERVAETIPAWASDARKAQVTIRQLLDFSSGLAPVFHLHNNDPGDRDSLAIKAPLVANPGSAFIYGPSSLQVFHAVLKAKLRGLATLPERSRRESIARIRVAAECAAMGEGGRSGLEWRRAGCERGFDGAMLARLGSEPRLLPWLVE